MGINGLHIGAEDEPRDGTPNRPNAEQRKRAGDYLEQLTGDRLDLGSAVFYGQDEWSAGERLARVNQILDIMTGSEAWSSETLRVKAASYGPEAIQAAELYRHATTHEGLTRGEGVGRLKTMQELLRNPHQDGPLEVTIAAESPEADKTLD